MRGRREKCRRRRESGRRNRGSRWRIKKERKKGMEGKKETERRDRSVPLSTGEARPLLLSTGTEAILICVL